MANTGLEAQWSGHNSVNGQIRQEFICAEVYGKLFEKLFYQVSNNVEFQK